MENALNNALRPFRLETFGERQGKWSDLSTYQWGFEFSRGDFPTLELWVGPLYYAISHI